MNYNLLFLLNILVLWHNNCKIEEYIFIFQSKVTTLRTLIIQKKKDKPQQ